MNISGRDVYSLTLRHYPDILNIDEMCSVLGVSTKTGYRLLREGQITSMKVGRTYRIPKVHLLTYLRVVGCSQAG
ncbi:MAG: helix-turn-helix domain-containing protein [Christensenellaceae bacterium]|nr:helix-turn-helix domain-containing protein [Christensenellaceae bacterium]